MTQEWYRLDPDQAAAQLGLDPSQGLTRAEAARRLDRHGPNVIREKAGKPPWRILFEQFTSTMVLILTGAAVISGFLGQITETVAIAAIVVLFALLGFFQEYRAEKAMAALKQMTVPAVRVRREGNPLEISAESLVPGDLVLLEAGNLVPADLRLLESANLRAQESALTGESEPVEKTAAALDQPDLPLGDRRNLAYMGTVVTYGRGVGMVVRTGMETELGKIASLIQGGKDELTPLQRQLNAVGRTLAIFGFLVAGLVLATGLFRGESLTDMFMIAVSVAVAVIPEGLPAVVTITLALGGQRMLRRKALIRKLPAVETLGAVTVICSDKTGTLTINRMTVTIIDVAGHSVGLAGTGREPAPEPSRPEIDPEPLSRHPPAVRLMAAGCALCNDAALAPDAEAEGALTAMGDPTEGALVVAALQLGLPKGKLDELFPRVAEIPFDSERKRMTTVHAMEPLPPSLTPALGLLPETGGPFLAITKGAVDSLLAVCSRIWIENQITPLTPEWRERIRAGNDQMAAKGMRVLGMAIKPLATPPAEMAPESLERGLILAGLMGMVDPPRPEVKRAVRMAREAGIRPIMITGDHPLTARFIAHDLGISRNGRVKAGRDIDRMNPGELAAAVQDVSVFARVAPEQKLRIVQALQKNQEVVAMTGDGVNDAPALRRADIGIAMGITGTDVSKEASDMVLLDDNFSTIVAAVEEGRAIYANIRRFVKFSIAGNIGKIIVILLAPLSGMTVALRPLQLLWLNLLTDGLLGLGLGLETPEPGIMQQPPRSPRAGFFSGGLKGHIARTGVLTGLVALGAGIFYFHGGAPQKRSWQTMIFTIIAFLQIGQALASRSSKTSFFNRRSLSNGFIWGMVILAAGLQLAVLYFSPLARIFGVVPLTAGDLAVCAFLGTSTFWTIELEKWVLRRRDARQTKKKEGDAK